MFHATRYPFSAFDCPAGFLANCTGKAMGVRSPLPSDEGVFFATGRSLPSSSERISLLESGHGLRRSPAFPRKLTDKHTFSLVARCHSLPSASSDPKYIKGRECQESARPRTRVEGGRSRQACRRMRWGELLPNSSSLLKRMRLEAGFWYKFGNLRSENDHSGAILCADPNRRIRNWKVNH